MRVLLLHKVKFFECNKSTLLFSIYKLRSVRTTDLLRTTDLQTVQCNIITIVQGKIEWRKNMKNRRICTLENINHRNETKTNFDSFFF